jgi:hypothetical protein
MAPSEKSQHAIRRSTRLPLEVPVRVTSLSEDFPFSQPCNTTLVNAHGCGLISQRPLVQGLQVRIEIVSAKRHTTAKVAEVVPLGGEPETWLVGLELDIPGNFWGIEYAPSDWKIEEGTAAAAPPVPPEPARQPGAPRRWRLTDVSMGACYLESVSPFSPGTPVLISARVLDKEYLLDGVVRATHPQTGMGVEFTRSESHRQRVEELIGQLMRNREAPKIFVGWKENQARKQDADVSTEAGSIESGLHDSDPLLELVRQGSSLTIDQFLKDLRAQRLGKRRDPRIEIALPVLLTGVDVKGRPLDQRVITVNISRGGALLEGIHGMLSEGDKISLMRGSKKEEFRVAWVVNDDAAAGARIGVAAIDPNTTFWDEVLEATSEYGLEAASLRGSAQL